MRRRTFLAASLASAMPPPTAVDDWQSVRRVVAVGDVHGDKDAFVAVLKMAGLIGEREQWTGGEAHLLQIGDIPARGPQTRQAFDLLMRLEKEAAAAGGLVHALIGNHDAGVIYGDIRSILPEEFGEFRVQGSEERLAKAVEAEFEARRRKGELPSSASEVEAMKRAWVAARPPGFVEHREAFSPSGFYGSWIRRNNAIIRINDTLYVHGGISPKYLGRSRSDLNEAIRRELADPERLLPGISTDPLGPLWYRGFAETKGPAIEAHLEKVLRFHGVRRIVIGHSVTLTIILPYFGGRVVNTDLGLSRFYGRPPACLILEGGEAVVLYRGTRIPVPGPRPGEMLAYLKAVEAADVQPSPVGRLIQGLEAGH